jgi:hypothetical protein
MFDKIFGISAKEKIVSAVVLLLILMVLGFQKVPPEEAARVQERLRQSEQNLDAAKARLQRSWDNSPLNPVQR